MKNSRVEEQKAKVSSWRIIWPMMPSFLKLGKVALLHPGSAIKMLKEAQGSKKRILAKYKSDKCPYDLPAYREGMSQRISDKAFLRPSRNIESNSPEIIAMANYLGAFQKTDREYAEACFDFVKMKVWFTFAAQLRGATGTLKIGKAMCIDKTHLFIALCRAAGIPAKFRMSQEAFSQNIYEHLTETDPIMKEWYDSTGYFALHAMAEAFLDGQWIPADFSMDYRYEAALGLPISRLGDEPEGTWNWSLPGSILRCEELPWLFSFVMGTILKLNTTMFLSLQERMETEGLELGNQALKEAGGVEAYDKKIRQTYKAILPEVSKKLFRAMNEIQAASNNADEVTKSPASGERG
jgi:hypothetical protein